MKQEKIIRPDAGTAKAMIDVAMRIDTKLKEVLDSEDLQRRAAQEAARRLYDDRIRKALEEMDVEHINNGKQGIRTSLLRNAGVDNVWQVSSMTYRQICDIEGLGEQSARKILDIVKHMRHHSFVEDIRGYDI